MHGSKGGTLQSVRLYNGAMAVDAARFVLVFAIFLAACAESAPPPAALQTPALASPSPDAPSATHTPTGARPVRFPQDDAAHDALLEWWYYNGHLDSQDGKSYGFELVVFKREAQSGRKGLVAHVAVIDHQRRVFQYSEAIAIPPQGSGPSAGFDLRVNTVVVQGAGGNDHIQGTTADYGLDLRLTSQKPPVLQGEDGFIGVSGSEQSYYYSRTRMAANGTLMDHGSPLAVAGTAWMDHQWGDFMLEGGGGWDWYSLQLDNGADIMLSVVRDDAGRQALVYGTYVDQAGRATHLRAEDFTVEAQSRWVSPATNGDYPMGWRLQVPGHALQLQLEPVLEDQELDTRASVGRAYWEGQVLATGTQLDQPVTGKGYVELTGYAKVS